MPLHNLKLDCHKSCNRPIWWREILVWCILNTSGSYGNQANPSKPPVFLFEKEITEHTESNHVSQAISKLFMNNDKFQLFLVSQECSAWLTKKS